MDSYNPEEILEFIYKDLLRELDLEQDTLISISSRQKHKHSDSMILEVGGKGMHYQVFVKYGAHFSGGGGWDIRSEFEGYSLVHDMICDKNAFFSVRPLLVMEEPRIIATIFVKGRMLQDVYKKGLMRFRNRKQIEESIYFTGLTAQWLIRFVEKTAKTREKVKTEAVLNFCKDRFNEIAKWNPLFSNYGIAGDEFAPFLQKVFDIYIEDSVRVVRNHGDFAPHNVLIDSKNRLVVIDIGFTVDRNNPMPFEDAAIFLNYLEQMKNNPVYRPSGIEMIIKTFIEELLGENEGRVKEFSAAYIKRILSHVAWLYHPERNPGSRWAEYSFKKWGGDRLKWLSRIIGERGSERRPVYEFLYHR